MFNNPFCTARGRADEIHTVIKYAQEVIEKMRAIKARTLPPDALAAALAADDDAIKRAHRW
jgi:hypothetical protein